MVSSHSGTTGSYCAALARFPQEIGGIAARSSVPFRNRLFSGEIETCSSLRKSFLRISSAEIKSLTAQTPSSLALATLPTNPAHCITYSSSATSTSRALNKCQKPSENSAMASLWELASSILEENEWFPVGVELQGLIATRWRVFLKKLAK